MIDPTFYHVLLATVAVAASPQAEVRGRLDGVAKTVAGQIVQLSQEQIVLETAAGRVSVKRSGLTTIKPTSDTPTPPKAEPAAWIELVDTSLIAIDGFRIDRQTAIVTLSGGKTIKLAKRDIQSVRFGSQNEAAARLWRKFRTSDASADQIVIRKGPGKIDAIEGVVRRVDDKAVAFELDGNAIPVPRAKVHGMIYYQIKGRRLPEAAAIVRLADGSRLAAEKFRLSEGRLRITTTAGVVVDLPWSRIKQFDFSSDRVTYLSDIESESIKWTPYLSPATPSPELEKLFGPRRDQALFGGKLRLPSPTAANGKYVEYDKGLALQSRTRLVYRLPKGYKSFESIVGIDSRVRPAGHVRLTILADKKKLFDRKLSGADKPVALSLDVRGAARLTIVVDFGDDLDVADHLNLALARIVK